MFKIPCIVKGFQTGGRPSKNPHVKIVPADFLLDEKGNVVDLWYGRDTSDHIPIERIYDFVNKKLLTITVAERNELIKLRIENKKMKKILKPIVKAQMNRKLENLNPFK